MQVCKGGMSGWKAALRARGSSALSAFQAEGNVAAGCDRALLELSYQCMAAEPWRRPPLPEVLQQLRQELLGQELLLAAVPIGRPPPAGSPCQGCSSSREVLTSAAGGDMDAVKAFVSTWGGAALQEERSGLGLLHYCAGRPGQHATVQWLLDRGAGVNQEDSRRRTPLWHAVVSGDADSVLVLGRAGANVNHPCLEGKTPLLALATHHGTAQAAQGGVGASVLATCQALLSFNAVDLRATFQGKMAEEWAPGIRDCIAEMRRWLPMQQAWLAAVFRASSGPAARAPCDGSLNSRRRCCPQGGSPPSLTPSPSPSGPDLVSRDPDHPAAVDATRGARSHP